MHSEAPLVKGPIVSNSQLSRKVVTHFSAEALKLHLSEAPLVKGPIVSNSQLSRKVVTHFSAEALKLHLAALVVMAAFVV
jgi:hypothetical protein